MLAEIVLGVGSRVTAWGTLLLLPKVCVLIPTCVLVLTCESAVARLELAEMVWLLVSGSGCMDRGEI